MVLLVLLVLPVLLENKVHQVLKAPLALEEIQVRLVKLVPLAFLVNPVCRVLLEWSVPEV